MKDTGGLVSDYFAQTERYRREGREIRLHECRSACTLALSLPNVCVYPASVLRFHQAYNRDTKAVDYGVSDALFRSYPEAVRRRLGYLTRQYRSLSGKELIELGVRNCNESPVMFARRKNAAPATRLASAAPAPEGSSRLAQFAGKLAGLFRPAAESSTPAPASTRLPPARMELAKATERVVPLPPVRPASLREETDRTSVGSIEPPGAPGVLPAPQTVVAEVAPLPPSRPARFASASAKVTLRAPLPYLITGAWPVLPSSLSAYAPLR